MKRLSALSLAAVVLFAVVAAYGQAPKRQATDDPARSAKPNEVSGFMRLKLDHSQKVLEGIVLKDFKMIAINSEKMALLTEDENWMVLQTSDYRTYSAVQTDREPVDQGRQRKKPRRSRLGLCTTHAELRRLP